MHLTVIPRLSGSFRKDVTELFARIGYELRKHDAWILNERVFADEANPERTASLRTLAYGGLDDGVTPCWLNCPAGTHEPIVGIQIHAVSGIGKPELLLEGMYCGRMASWKGINHVSISQITAPETGSISDQASAIFKRADMFLKGYLDRLLAGGCGWGISWSGTTTSTAFGICFSVSRE